MDSPNRYNLTDLSRHTHPSNYGERTRQPLGVCVHTTAGSNSLAWLQSDRRATTKPSGCDYLINRAGERYKLTPKDFYAHHVGKGTWNGLTNDRSGLAIRWIGVELEQQKDELCTWQQLDSLAEQVVLSASEYGWRWPYSIVGHYELARPYGRRSDPQGFDWGHFMGYLYARSLAAGVDGLVL